MTEVEKSKFTQLFLRTVSEHLSSRQECRGSEYVVSIQDREVSIVPNIQVFPDRYHRKDTDKRSVVYHVASHFESQLDPQEVEGVIRLNTDQLVMGQYEYQSSVDKKKRRWVKVESL